MIASSIIRLYARCIPLCDSTFFILSAPTVNLTLTRRLWMGFALMALLTLTSTLAVSYTHLDVYKRQLYAVLKIVMPPKPDENTAALWQQLADAQSSFDPRKDWGKA